MSHKIAILKKGAPYTGTVVPFERSLQQIQEMLEKFKCSRIAVQKDMRGGEFPLTTLVFEKGGYPYIIEFPVIYVSTTRNKELKMSVSGRIIHDRIKALLVEVEIGVLDFSQAMMHFVAIPSAHGKPMMLQDFVTENLPQIAKGSFDIQYSLPAPKKEEDRSSIGR